jgi:uncharacterized protein with FMN-binding domain
MARGMHRIPVSDSTSRQNGLLALGSAAVLTVYTAGYLKTKAAADKFEAASRRRPPAPTPGAAPATSTATAVEAMPRNGAPPAARPGTEAGTPQLPAMARSENAAAPSAASPTSPTTSANAATATTTAVAAPTAVTSAPPVETPPAAAAVAVDSVPHAAVKAAEAEKPLPMPAVKLRDGTYYGWGTSRHGDIQAVVTIEAGRIVRAGIAQCLTRYSCSWIAALPPQVVQRQSAEVDYVSGATQSVNAFYYAILEALAQAK